MRYALFLLVLLSALVPVSGCVLSGQPEETRAECNGLCTQAQMHVAQMHFESGGRVTCVCER